MMMMMMSSLFSSTLFLLLSLLIPLFSHVTACDPHQRESLLHLKAGFHFDSPIHRLTSWRPSSNCCNWEGVTCNHASGLVTELDLNSYGISGNISPTLFNLTSLNKLNLAFNYFFGGIPNGIGLLGDLMSLNLSYAGFIGQIPIGIANLTKLATLDLSSNFFFGLRLEDPDFGTLIRNLSNLNELQLDGVNISAHGHQWGSAVAKSTPHLRVLSLSSTSITGPFDSSLSQLHHLSVIRLEQNNQDCTMPDFFGSFFSLSELHLWYSGLIGTFPKNVFRLKNLTVLDLSSNPMLSGSLPEFIDKSKLQTLMLWTTNFSGPLPYTIGNLKSLITMRLGDCLFSGTIPSSIANLTLLEFLSLSFNNLVGSIPSSLGKLQHLTEVYLGGNMLSGEIPTSLLSMPSLQTLFLESNNLSGEVTLDQFSQNLEGLSLSDNKILIKDTMFDNSSLSFPKLRDLRLASCNLTRIPSFLRYHDQMDFLDLSRNMIHGVIPSWIWSIGGELVSLNLSCNFFTFVEPFNLSYSSSWELDLHSNLLEGPIPLPGADFRLIDYSNNRLSSSIPSNISSYLRYAKYISLAHNNLVGEIPPSICLVILALLDLSSNNFTGLIPQCLLEGDNDLIILNLQRNQLSGSIPWSSKKGCCLKTLQLNDNHLQGQLPNTIVNCNELEVINLGNNHIHDSFFFWLSQIPSLQVLILKSNEFYGPIKLQSNTDIAANIFNFSRLQILDVSFNKFSGTLSPHFFMSLRAMMGRSAINNPTIGSYDIKRHYYQDTVTITTKGLELTLVKILTIFNSIDLSNNAFIGEIPEVFGEFQSLVVLNLSHNSLTGTISPALGSMKQLESLDLSVYHLLGEIPQELTSLTFLGFLNLSNNYLVGRIPQGNQFSTFSNSSFKGNQGLCGIPLSKQCSSNTTQTMPAPSGPDNSTSSTYVIGLALSAGLGYGVGIAAVIVLQNVSWKRISAWFYATAANAMN